MRAIGYMQTRLHIVHDPHRMQRANACAPGQAMELYTHTGWVHIFRASITAFSPPLEGKRTCKQLKFKYRKEHRSIRTYTNLTVAHSKRVDLG